MKKVLTLLPLTAAGVLLTALAFTHRKRRSALSAAPVPEGGRGPAPPPGSLKKHLKSEIHPQGPAGPWG